MPHPTLKYAVIQLIGEERWERIVTEIDEDEFVILLDSYVLGNKIFWENRREHAFKVAGINTEVLNFEIFGEINTPTTFSGCLYDRYIFHACFGGTAFANDLAVETYVNRYAFKSDLWELYCRRVDPINRIDLSGGNFVFTGFPCWLCNAKLGNATLLGNMCSVNLEGADLTNANFTGAERYVLDGNIVRNTIFPRSSKDPYSILRRIYTGPHFAIILALSIAALTPHAIYGFLPGTKKQKVWEAVFAVNEGWWATFATVTLILYNLLRAYVTVRMSELRDIEERSHYAPARYDYFPIRQWRDWRWYKSPYFLHNYFLWWMYYCSLVSFLIKLLLWLSSDAPQIPRLDWFKDRHL